MCNKFYPEIFIRMLLEYQTTKNLITIYIKQLRTGTYFGRKMFWDKCKIQQKAPKILGSGAKKKKTHFLFVASKNKKVEVL